MAQDALVFIRSSACLLIWFGVALFLVSLGYSVNVSAEDGPCRNRIVEVVENHGDMALVSALGEKQYFTKLENGDVFSVVVKPLHGREQEVVYSAVLFGETQRETASERKIRFLLLRGSDAEYPWEIETCFQYRAGSVQALSKSPTKIIDDWNSRVSLRILALERQVNLNSEANGSEPLAEVSAMVLRGKAERIQSCSAYQTIASTASCNAGMLVVTQILPVAHGGDLKLRGLFASRTGINSWCPAQTRLVFEPIPLASASPKLIQASNCGGSDGS